MEIIERLGEHSGIQDILMTCVDNLPASLKPSACYPQTEIQKCIIYQIRHSTRYMSYQDMHKVTADPEPIYKAATEEAALAELDRFEELGNGVSAGDPQTHLYDQYHRELSSPASQSHQRKEYFPSVALSGMQNNKFCTHLEYDV
ncbi:transposase and inactivated derivative [Paenibacillus popilliae ATCC 14706]|uniref:Mutator family transposase n=1 Tax=Paenibacillus popilliae ATCC 14706 TaxID=1212764 RepID=M9L8F8_PAEPP|nr:transposase and inactivated derivative [Paenibacillus popilliae ATCC 14706]